MEDIKLKSISDLNEELNPLLSAIVRSRKDPALFSKLMEFSNELLEDPNLPNLNTEEPGWDKLGEDLYNSRPVLISGLDNKLQRKLFEEALDMIVIADADTGIIVDCNAQAMAVTGRTRDELIGKPQRILHPEWEHDQGFSKSFRIQVSDSDGSTMESQVITKTGAVKDMSIKANIVQEGSRRLLQGVFRDITQKKKDRERLKELEFIINMSPVVALVWIPSPGWPVKFATSNCEKLFGYSASELTGGTIRYLDLIYFQDRDRIIREVNEAIADTYTKSFVQEYRIVDRYGAVRWVADRTFMDRDYLGEVRKIQGIVWDVSERKASQQAFQTMLKHEEALSLCSRELVSHEPRALDRSLAHLLKASGASRIYMFKNLFDPEHGLCMNQVHEVCADGVPSELHNPELQKLPYNQGFSRWESMLPKDLLISGPMSEFPDSEREVLAPQGILSILIIPIWVHGYWWGYIGFDDIVSSREWNENELRLLKTGAEIVGNYVERESTALLLQDSEERFRSMAAMAPQPIFEADSNGRLTFASDKAFEMFGYEKDDLDRGFNILDVIAEEDRGKAVERLGQRKLGRDGEPTEYKAIFKDNTIKPVLICSSPIMRSGEYHGVRGIIIDISERKKNEKLMAQMEKYRAVADLSAGVAHNFNNMLQIIMGNAELARNHIRANKISDIEQNLEEMIDTCKFASDTVKRLNRYAAETMGQNTASNHSVFDLYEVVSKSLEITNALRSDESLHRGGDISVSDHLQTGLYVKGSYSETLEVLVNILKNAVEAMPEGGVITVKMWQSDNIGFVSVADTGVGVSPENLERIFTPFYTSSANIGRGLGLATCLKIVKDMGGHISATSSVGQGSTFTIQLPLTEPDRSKRE